jgi:hypothetical protein
MSPIFSRRRFLASAAAGLGLASLGEAAAAERREVPWLAEVQRPPAALPKDAPRLSPLLVADDGRPITALDAWQRRREQIRRWWLDFLRPLKVERKENPRLEVLEEDRPEGVIRQRVRYEVEPGEKTEAYLLRPATGPGPRPGVVVLHSTVNHTILQPAGLEGPREMHIGLHLAQRGFVAFCPRNFLWTENRKMDIQQALAQFGKRHPESKGMAKMLYDAVVALDLLAAEPEVDPKRLGAVGHSLGAKEVLYLAAFDERIRAAVSSEGGVGIPFTNWHDPWYLGGDVRRKVFADSPHEHHELLALAAPRAFLLLGGDSADGAKSWPFIESALPVYRLYGGAGRLGLLNHGKGHALPPEAETRLYQWLEAYLGTA